MRGQLKGPGRWLAGHGLGWVPGPLRGCCGCLVVGAAAVLVVCLALIGYALVPNAYPPYPAAARAALRAESTGSGQLPWLHSNGRAILDSSGSQVLLRGMNVTGLLQARDMSPGPVPTRGDFVAMAADGFDVIRIPVSWSRLEPGPGRFSAAYLAQIAAMVNEAAAQGIYSIIDLHNIDWSVYYGGDGAPSWVTAGFLPRSFPGPSPWSRHLAPGVLASYGIFWSDLGGWQQDVVQVWSRLARSFRNDSAVAGFDLWNEPHPFPIPPGLFEAKFLLPFEANLISQLAKIAPRQMWITEQTLDFGLPTYVGRLPYPNQVFSSHVFATLLEPPWQAPKPQYATPLSLLEAQARTAGAAPWVGEIGGPPGASSQAWIGREMNELDRYRLGWAYWDWDEGGAWAFVRQPARLRLVARVYPRLTPGTLTELDYSPATGRISLGFTGPTQGRPLVLEVPHFYSRYRVVSSSPGTDLSAHLDLRSHQLIIHLTAGARPVAISIQFRG